MDRQWEILKELRAIRELLEWNKAHTLELMAKREEEEARCKAEAAAQLDDILARQKTVAEEIAMQQRAASEELARQQFERYRQEEAQSREEHEVRYHGRPRATQEVTVQ